MFSDKYGDETNHCKKRIGLSSPIENDVCRYPIPIRRKDTHLDITGMQYNAFSRPSCRLQTGILCFLSIYLGTHKDGPMDGSPEQTYYTYEL